VLRGPRGLRRRSDLILFHPIAGMPGFSDDAAARTSTPVFLMRGAADPRQALAPPRPALRVSRASHHSYRGKTPPSFQRRDTTTYVLVLPPATALWRADRRGGGGRSAGAIPATAAPRSNQSRYPPPERRANFVALCATRPSSFPSSPRLRPAPVLASWGAPCAF